jgi:two-component system sensor histidine kinase/response regulator
METESSTILLIDDEQRLLLGLSAVMKRAGFSVLTANTGKDGLRLAREQQPDLIVCDVMMPPPNGFELRKELAQYPATAEIPFIFLTARVSDADKLFGLNMEIDDYITKPFNRQELISRVKAVLRRVDIGRKQGQAVVEEELDKLRHEIIQNVSHEFRTPLAKILTSLELVLDDKFADDPEHEKNFIQLALANTHRMHNLINDLIFLTEADREVSDPLRLPVNLKFDFQQPINHTVEYWQHKNLRVNMSTDSEIEILASRNEFSQAVCHLVDNACKFSPDGGKIDINLVGQGRGGCILSISDQGPGIKPSQRKKVFERYYQVSQGLARQYEGLGVGLNIAQLFARSLGGDVKILDSEVGCWMVMDIPPLPATEQTA